MDAEASLRRLADFVGVLKAELGSSVTIETGPVGPYLSVSLAPCRPGAMGIEWLQSDCEIILMVDSGGRWELGPNEEDMDFLEDIVRSVIFGRVTIAKGQQRSHVEVTLADGTLEQWTRVQGLGALLPQRGWQEARQQFAPYE